MQIFEKFSKILKDRGINLTEEQEKKVYENFLTGFVLDIVEAMENKIDDSEKKIVSDFLSSNKIKELLDFFSSKFSSEEEWQEFIEDKTSILLDNFMEIYEPKSI
jgi:hypothetical protein